MLRDALRDLFGSCERQLAPRDLSGVVAFVARDVHTAEEDSRFRLPLRESPKLPLEGSQLVTHLPVYTSGK